MKTKKIAQLFLLVFCLALGISTGYAAGFGFADKKQTANNDKTYQVYYGKIVDAETLQPLIFASVGITGTNIATVTNTEGVFSIKIPENQKAAILKISFIGYESKKIAVSNLKNNGKKNVIKLKLVSVKLTEISVFPNNPRLIIEKVLENKRFNYATEPMLMTAFYRETIRKRNSYVGLSEAVVEVYKQSYSSLKNDQVKLYKGRKSQDVDKMDTLLFKLQGGPLSTLMLDVVKDPYLILEPEVMRMYEYTFVNITKVDGRLNYVIDFKQNPYVTTPLFYGRFYIDMDNFAITSVVFNLNTENKEEVSNMFIKKKPLGVRVQPTSANYLVNYREQDGKWYYSYSRGEVKFKVNWKRKLFNTRFSTMVEMAITDRKTAPKKTFQPSDRLHMNVVMADAVTGFAEDDFWGDYNTIEPEQSIESAIKRISKSLDKK